MGISTSRAGERGLDLHASAYDLRLANIRTFADPKPDECLLRAASIPRRPRQSARPPRQGLTLRPGLIAARLGKGGGHFRRVRRRLWRWNGLREQRFVYACSNNLS